MTIDQITDQETLTSVKEQLDIVEDVVVFVRTEDNGDQYLLVQRSDGCVFLFNRLDNSYLIDNETVNFLKL